MKYKLSIMWMWLYEKYRSLPQAIRAAWNTAWITFVGSMLMILTSVLGSLTEVLGSGNYEAFYDHLSFLATALLSAVFAFLIGVLNALYRFIKPVETSYNLPTRE